MNLNLDDFRVVLYGDQKIYFEKKHSFHEYFKHKRKITRFPFHKDVLMFLSENSDINIFFTLDQDVLTFKKTKQGFLININSYLEFCSLITSKANGRVKAFLGQNISINNVTSTQEQKDDFIKANASEDNIMEAMKTLSVESQIKLLAYLKSVHAETDGSLEVLDSLKNVDSNILKSILGKLSRDVAIDTILEVFSKVELENLYAASKQTIYQTELKNLKQLLELEEKEDIVGEIKKYENLSSYVSGQPEKIFQNWIEKNLWVFGIDYIKKYDPKEIAIFSKADLLMESMDGFLDLIELKRPKLEYEIFNYDSSHKSYYPSPDLSKVIGQCLFYLQKMDDYKLNLEKEHKVKIIRPRIKIIAGRTDKFVDEQFEALRMLNSNLNHIQIISYDYLFNCGEKIISFYEK